MFSLPQESVNYYLGKSAEPRFTLNYIPSEYLTLASPKAQPVNIPAEPSLRDRLFIYEGLLGSILGRILNAFEWTIAVEDEGGNRVWVDVGSLTKELLGGVAPASKRLQNLVLENLQPVIGKEVTWRKVEALFSDFRTAEQPAVERLESLKMRHLEVLDYGSSSVMSKLKPGDIFFKKVHEEDSHPVVLGQSIAYHFMSAPKEREGHKFSHAAVYLGNGRIAEASPHHDGCEVRSVSLDDPRFALDAEHSNRYLVCRFHDESLAREAAQVAESVAQPVVAAEATEFKYSKLQALRSIWHSASFGPFARYRYLKQYIDDHKGERPVDFMQKKGFFCSYFVGYCFQTAESRRTMPPILGDEDRPTQGWTTIGSAVFRGLWARLRRLGHWNEMSEAVKLQFDAKRLTPQNLRNFTVAHPELFKDVLMLRAT